LTDPETEKNLAKRIGDYLVCSAGTLKNAVKRQGQLLKQGQAIKPIGEILLENKEISREDLDTAIRKQRVDRIKLCPVFNSLSGMELSALSTKFTEVSIPAGEQFIYQDMPDPKLYIIATGKVEVYRTDMAGNKTHIAYVEPYEPIGEMGYFSGGIRTASVRAVDVTELLCADYESLTHYFERVPRVAHAFTQMVEQRRRATEAIMQKGRG
jgi:CRP-like cAMP-binding protein